MIKKGKVAAFSLFFFPGEKKLRCVRFCMTYAYAYDIHNGTINNKPLTIPVGFAWYRTCQLVQMLRKRRQNNHTHVQNIRRYFYKYWCRKYFESDIKNMYWTMIFFASRSEIFSVKIKIYLFLLDWHSIKFEVGVVYMAKCQSGCPMAWPRGRVLSKVDLSIIQLQTNLPHMGIHNWSLPYVTLL